VPVLATSGAGRSPPRSRRVLCAFWGSRRYQQNIFGQVAREESTDSGQGTFNTQKQHISGVCGAMDTVAEFIYPLSFLETWTFCDGAA
jgi:hypothetical protein